MSFISDCAETNPRRRLARAPPTGTAIKIPPRSRRGSLPPRENPEARAKRAERRAGRRNRARPDDRAIKTPFYRTAVINPTAHYDGAF